MGWDLEDAALAGNAASDATSLARRDQAAAGSSWVAANIPAPRSHAFSSSTRGVDVDDVKDGGRVVSQHHAPASGWLGVNAEPRPVVWAPAPPATPILLRSPSPPHAPPMPPQPPQPPQPQPNVSADLQAERYSALKQRVEEAREKLKELQLESGSWRSKADAAEAELEALNQRLAEVEDQEKALESLDQLKIERETREAQLRQADERVKRGAVREREADSTISQLRAQLVLLQDTHSSLLSHKAALDAAHVAMVQELEETKAKVAYLQALVLYKTDGPEEDKLHLDLRLQQHLQTQCRDLQASCLSYQLKQSAVEAQLSSLGMRLDERKRIASEQDILYSRAAFDVPPS